MAYISKTMRRAAIAAAMSITSFTSGMAKADTKTAAADNTVLAQNANSENDITHMAGLQEQTAKPSGIVESFYAHSWQSYLKRRGSKEDLDKEIDKCRQNPAGCTRVMKEWVASIDAVNNLPNESIDDQIMRAHMVAGFAGAFGVYDLKKGTVGQVISNYIFHGGKEWLKTPQELFFQTKGEDAKLICGDYATITYETLIRTGFDPRNIRIIGGKLAGGFHTVPMININKTNFILAQGMEATPTTPYLVTDTTYVSGFTLKDFNSQNNGKDPIGLEEKNISGFTPLVSFNENGFHRYTGTLQRELIREIRPTQFTYSDLTQQAFQQKLDWITDTPSLGEPALPARPAIRQEAGISLKN